MLQRNFLEPIDEKQEQLIYDVISIFPHYWSTILNKCWIKVNLENRFNKSEQYFFNTISKPWFEESIFAGFGQMNIAVKNQFDIAGIRQKDHNIVSKESSGYISVYFTKPQTFFHNFFKCSTKYN